MNKNKLERRLDHLTRLECFVTKESLEGQHDQWYESFRKNATEIYSIFDQLGITDQNEIERFWKTNYMKQLNLMYSYKKGPRRERKDNKNTINYGTGNSNRNTIRYPKKCRKTAWKRFYKLFPNLKENKETKDI